MRLKTVFSYIIGTLLTALAASGSGDDHYQGRLLVVTNGTADQEAYLVPDFVYFVPEDSLVLFEDTLVTANATHIGRVPINEGSFSCYLLNRDNDIPSTEQGIFLCISPEWQVDRVDSDEGDLVTNSYKVRQAEEQWFDTPSSVWSIDDDTSSLAQQLSSLLSSLLEWLVFSDNVSEKAEKNSTSFALPEWPASTPESTLQLLGGDFPFDPPFDSPPPLFMPDISAKGLFDMPDWQFDYLLALARISQRLKQWLHNGHPTTSSKSRQFVSATDLSAALERITQKKAFNKPLFSQVPLDASKLLAQLSGKGLPGYSQVHQPETVMLYPVFKLPQSASNDFEEAQGVEYVGEACSICLTHFEKSDDVLKTPCSHLFHIDCLTQWLTTTIDGMKMSFCPICRENQEALNSFLTRKEDTLNQERLASSERAALQEITHIVKEMQSGRMDWPEDDRYFIGRLHTAVHSNIPAIAEQAWALRSFVYFYSVQRLVSQVQARRETWPENDDYFVARLDAAVNSNDPTLAEQARALRPFVYFYSVQNLVSQVQAGRKTWPENGDYLVARLRVAENSNDPTLAEQARALRLLVDKYGSKSSASQSQVGCRLL
ncbi:MAG: RING finger domain-containing protein [Endozoicomonas sp.]